MDDSSARDLVGGVLVAAAFVGGQLAGGSVLAGVGVLQPPATAVESALLTVAVGGLVVGGTVAWSARRLAGAGRVHLVVWTSLVFLNMAGVMLEGAFFAPDLAPVENLPGGLLQQAGVALLTAAVAAWWFPRYRDAAPIGPGDVSDAGARGRDPRIAVLVAVAAGTATYVVLFFVVGALNYQLVTRPFYEAHVGGLTTPPVEVLLGLELVRGVLIAASVLPFVRAVQGTTRERRLAAGGVLFVFSGLVPLAFQLFTLPSPLLAASAYEILLQVGPTGVVVVALLDRYRAADSPR